MFERFTELARVAVVGARDLTRQYGHDEVEPEHLVWAMSRMPEALAGKALSAQRIGDGVIGPIMLDTFGGRDAIPLTTPVILSAATKRVLELALREALGLGHNYVGSEHVLLGVLRLKDRPVLKRIFDTSEEDVRAQVLRLLNGTRAPTTIRVTGAPDAAGSTSTFAEAVTAAVVRVRRRPVTCAKCGDVEHAVVYHSGDRTAHDCSFWAHTKVKGEHLHLTCKTCGWDWTTPIEDARAAPMRTAEEFSKVARERNDWRLKCESATTELDDLRASAEDASEHADEVRRSLVVRLRGARASRDAWLARANSARDERDAAIARADEAERERDDLREIVSQARTVMHQKLDIFGTDLVDELATLTDQNERAEAMRRNWERSNERQLEILAERDAARDALRKIVATPSGEFFGDPGDRAYDLNGYRMVVTIAQAALDGSGQHDS